MYVIISILFHFISIWNMAMMRFLHFFYLDLKLVLAEGKPQSETSIKVEIRRKYCTFPIPLWVVSKRSMVPPMKLPNSEQLQDPNGASATFLQTCHVVKCSLCHFFYATLINFKPISFDGFRTKVDESCRNLGPVTAPPTLGQ